MIERKDQENERLHQELECKDHKIEHQREENEQLRCKFDF